MLVVVEVSRSLLQSKETTEGKKEKGLLYHMSIKKVEA